MGNQRWEREGQLEGVGQGLASLLGWEVGEGGGGHTTLTTYNTNCYKKNYDWFDFITSASTASNNFESSEVRSDH